MNRLSQAIENEEWELAAVLLLLGVVRTLNSLPPESADALITLIVEDGVPEPGTFRHHWQGDGRWRHRHD